MSKLNLGLENFILDSDEFEKADWSKAKRAEFGAPSGLDQGTQMFWARLDALEFSRLDSLIEKVLVAHGFEVNLENILYCIENLKLGRKVDWLKNAANQKVKQYESVFAFELPRKGRSGSLLQRFYGILQSKDGHSAETAPRTTPPGLEKILSKKIENLEAKNMELQKELARLRDQHLSEALLRSGIAQAVREFAPNVKTLGAGGVPQASLAGGRILPDHWKLEICTVSAIDWDHQTVTIRIGRKTLSLGFAKLFAAPSVQAIGIALLGGTELQAVLPLGEKWASFHYDQALVLAHVKSREASATSGKLKLRLSNGLEMLYRYQQSIEETQKEPLIDQSMNCFAKPQDEGDPICLKRHDTVVLCYSEDRVFKLHCQRGDRAGRQTREVSMLLAQAAQQSEAFLHDDRLIDQDI